MYEHPHLRYLNYSQQVELKPLKQGFYDINPTCKDAFLDFWNLYRISYPYFVFHDFLASPIIDVHFFCAVKIDVMMTICKTRDKPLDVVTKNRVVDMTSVDWATPLVNECEVKRRKR